MVSETLELIVRTSGALNADRAFRGIGTGASQAANDVLRSTAAIRAAMAGLGTGFTIAERAARASSAQISAVGAAVQRMVQQNAAAKLGALGVALREVGTLSAVSAREMSTLGVAIQRATGAASTLQMRTLGTALKEVGTLSAVSAREMSTLGVAIQRATGAASTLQMRTLGTALKEVGAASAQQMRTLGVALQAAAEQAAGLNSWVVRLRASLMGMGAAAKESSGGVSSLRQSMGMLRNLLVAFSAFKAFEWIGTEISTLGQLNNLLSTVTNSVQDQRGALLTLADAAQKVHAPMDGFVKLVTAMKLSTAGFGVSNTDLVKGAQTIFSTFALSGLDTKSISNVKRDIIEVFNLGIVQGRIFRSVMTQDQQEALVLSKYIQASGANAAKVNKELTAQRTSGAQPNIYEMTMKNKGAFTGADVLKANVAAYNDVMGKMAKTTKTVGQALVDLQTKFLIFMSNVDQLVDKLGGTKGLAGVIETIGNNLPAIVAVAAAFASMLVINLVTSSFASFGNTIGSVFKFAFGFVSELLGLLRGLAIFILGLSAPVLLVAGAILAVGAVVYAVFHTQINSAASNYLKQVQDMGGWTEWLIRMIAVIGADFETAFQNPLLFVKMLGEQAINVVNDMISGIQYLINAGIKGLDGMIGWADSHLPKWAQLPQVSQIDLGQVGNPLAGSTANFDKKLNANAGDIYKQIKGGQKYLSDLFSGLGAGLNLVGGGKPPKTDTGNYKLQEATASFQDFIDSARPGGAVLKAMDEAQKKLNEAMHAGVNVQGLLKASGLTWADVLKHQELAAIGYKDKLVELHRTEQDIAEAAKSHKIGGTVVGPALDQATASRLTNDAIAKAAGLKGAEQDLFDQEKALTEAVGKRLISQTAMNAVMEKARVDQAAYKLELENTAKSSAAAEVMKNQPSLLQGSWGEQEASALMKVSNATAEYQAKLEALNVVAATGALTQKQYGDALRDLQLELLKTNTDIGSGLQAGILEADKSMNDLAKTISGTVTQAFEGLTDAITKSIVTGQKLNLKAVGQQFETGLVKTAVQGSITGPLASGLSSLVPGLGGLLGKDASGQLGASSGNAMWVQMANSSLTNLGLGGVGGTGNPLSDATAMAGSGGGLLGAFGGSGAGAGGYGSSGTPLIGGGALFGNSGILGSLFSGGGSGGASGGMFGAGGLFGAGGFFGNVLNGTGAAGSSSAGLDSFFGASSGGLLGDLSDFIGFSGGGQFQVGGAGGTDSQLVAFRATPDETVTIKRPGQPEQELGASQNFHVHLHGGDAVDTFNRSPGQTTASMMSMASRVSARNGNQQSGKPRS